MEWKEKNRKSRKRISLLLGGAVLVWSLLGSRLYYWQIVCHEQLSEAASLQYQVEVDGMDARGRILDRNLQPLTGGTERYYYFLQKESMNARVRQLLRSVSAVEITSAVPNADGYEVYRTEVFQHDVSRELKETFGAYVFSAIDRYHDTQTACHLIGYLNQSEGRGVYGLEQVYENVLHGEEQSLVLWADGKGRILLNLPPEQTGGYSLKESCIITTLDRELQNFCEASLSDRNLEGTILVSDSRTGEILAWVSAPAFNPNRVESYLEGGKGNLVNKCIQGLYAPGSVFKIVTAAAALEAGTVHPGAVYECTGETEVHGVTLGCQAGPKEGHGLVNLYDAMAMSCNCYFAQLGAEIGTDAILDMAQRFGFGKTVFHSFMEESAGYLPTKEETGPWDTSNLAIGQGKLLVTPAQIHQMMSVAAGGGQLHPLNVVQSESNHKKEIDAVRILDEYTAEQLSVMLQQVMTDGTAGGREWDAVTAGKTGTAEGVRNGYHVKNCWFSGFCRGEENCFVVTVLVEDGISGSASAVPVFEEIYDYLRLRFM